MMKCELRSSPTKLIAKLEIAEYGALLTVPSSAAI